MNRIFLLATISTLFVSANAISANAEGKQTIQSAIVASKVKTVTSMSIGNEIRYLKTFDLIISNPTDKPLNISTGCLVATGPERTEFKLDTIEGTLKDGTLLPGKTITGFASFASKTATVHNANAVTLAKNCK